LKKRSVDLYKCMLMKGCNEQFVRRKEHAIREQ